MKERNRADQCLILLSVLAEGGSVCAGVVARAFQFNFTPFLNSFVPPNTGSYFRRSV